MPHHRPWARPLSHFPPHVRARLHTHTLHRVYTSIAFRGLQKHSKHLASGMLRVHRGGRHRRRGNRICSPRHARQAWSAYLPANACLNCLWLLVPFAYDSSPYSPVQPSHLHSRLECPAESPQRGGHQQSDCAVPGTRRSPLLGKKQTCPNCLPLYHLCCVDSPSLSPPTLRSVRLRDIFDTIPTLQFTQPVTTLALCTTLHARAYSCNATQRNAQKDMHVDACIYIICMNPHHAYATSAGITRRCPSHSTPPYSGQEHYARLVALVRDLDTQGKPLAQLQKEALELNVRGDVAFSLLRCSICPWCCCYHCCWLRHWPWQRHSPRQCCVGCITALTAVANADDPMSAYCRWLPRCCCRSYCCVPCFPWTM